MHIRLLYPNKNFLLTAHNAIFEILFGSFMGRMKLQEWTMTEGIAGVDIAGVDNDVVMDSEFKLLQNC